MRKLLCLGILMVALISMGCAKKMFVKPGGTNDGFQRDLAQCQYEAEVAIASYGNSDVPPTMSNAIASGIFGGIEMGTRKNKLIQMCLGTKGWTEHTGSVPVSQDKSGCPYPDDHKGMSYYDSDERCK